jgi:hypothetical protein
MAGKGKGIEYDGAINTSGDNVAEMMVSRMVEGRNWLKKPA